MSRILSILLLWLVSCTLLPAQTVFNMQNLFVTDCEGTLLDSEAGAGGSTYANNENFTFKICSGAKITMSFVAPFCVETNFDFLRFFDGPDTNSILLATYTGYTVPPPVVANSGCLTVHFKSDGNAAYCGWEAHWTTDKIPPTPPLLTINPIPACSTNQITVNLSKRILCDSVQPSDFILTGPVPGLLVTAVNGGPQCLLPGDTSNQFVLFLNKQLTQNCTYNLVADIGVLDNCDSLWHFTLTDSFTIYNCPFNVTINAIPDTICPGLCTDLTAVVSGSGPTCLNYNYTWNNGLPNSSGPHSVCPTSTTNYTVSVQSTFGGPVVNASRNVVVVNPVINEPDTILVCQSDPAFQIKVLTGGGKFRGPGIVNTTTGLFEPDSANNYVNYIKYGFPNFCEDSIMIYVTPIDAGLDQAACPGSTPFQLVPVFPPNGIWTGAQVSPTGLFTPTNPGSYVVTYSANGCVDSITVTVDSIVLNTKLDTICQSDAPFIISITPPGGRWQGPAIDSITGLFNPGLAGSGNKSLLYKVNGCNFNVNFTVNPINAGGDITVCPLQAPFLISPAGQPFGGTWSGFGIINSILGLYSPTTAFGGGTGNDILTYTHPNGCSDTKTVYVRNTIVPIDTFFFCIGDTAFELSNNNTGSVPGGGIWTGTGVIKVGTKYFFNPSLAGVGIFSVSYTAHTCSDNAYMVVFPSYIRNAPSSVPYPDTVVCSTHPAWNFPPMPPGGTWTGPGITDPVTGRYNPSVAPAGLHTIKYETPGNCVNDSIMVQVYTFVEARILNLDSAYCYRDTNYLIQFTPKDAALNGQVDSANRFNPAKAGAGTHVLFVSYGYNLCLTRDTATTVVYPELVNQISVSDYTLCPGESADIDVNATGGKPGAAATYSWNEGLFPVGQQTVTPSQTTTYIVRTSDGCSADDIDSITIVVSPKIKADIETSQKLCYGLSGFAKVLLPDTTDFDIEWQTKPIQTEDSIEAYAGSSYQVIITDPNTSCLLDTTIFIPSFKNVTARFSTSPNFDCIPSDQKTVTFLDLSQNADSGTWDIAGLKTIPYELGKNPVYTFNGSGTYTVKLDVYNEGGCHDEFSMDLCVEDITPLFVADAFSPNGDGINDVLHVKGQGVKNVVFTIYDRWGVPVFRTENIEEGWDGTINGMKANQGVYIYVVESRLIDNESVFLKGNVTLVR